MSEDCDTGPGTPVFGDLKNSKGWSFILSETSEALRKRVTIEILEFKLSNESLVY